MFTPGPWRAVRNSCFWEIRDSSGDQIGDACASSAGAPNHGRSDELGEANARLMAAAPELLEALKAIVAAEDEAKAEWEREGMPAWNMSHPAMQRLEAARKAIAKAEGAPSEIAKED